MDGATGGALAPQIIGKWTFFSIFKTRELLILPDFFRGVVSVFYNKSAIFKDTKILRV